MTDHLFNFSGRTIVIISPECWGDNLLSKHHFALALAKRCNTVWFVCPCSGSDDKMLPELPSNIRLIQYKPIRGFHRLPTILARFAAMIEVSKLRREIGAKIDVVWSFDPYQLQYLKLFRPRIAIYHPVDNHYTRYERTAVKNADIVFSNSDKTLMRIQHINKHKIGHGVAAHFFETPSTVSLPGNFSVKVGYVGNLNNRFFDFDLLIRLAKTHPEIGFYLVGPRAASNLSPSEKALYDWSEAEKLSNIFWLGQQPSHRIPSYLRRMDILLVLYKPDAKGFTVNAHKTLEYLSSGKLVISTVHDENLPIRHLILQADDRLKLPEVFADAVENLDKHLSADIQASRVEYALSVKYENRLREIEAAIRKTLLSHD